jgi:hypothetical protein
VLKQSILGDCYSQEAEEPKEGLRRRALHDDDNDDDNGNSVSSSWLLSFVIESFLVRVLGGGSERSNAAVHKTWA